MKQIFSFLSLALALVATLAIVSCSGVATVRNERPTPAFTPHSFGNENTLKFIVMGDWGMGTPGQMLIAQRMDEKAEKDGAAFVLLTGDNFYYNGVSGINDEQWQTKWRDVYTGKSLQIPFYAVLGNHDYGHIPGFYTANSQAQIEFSAHDPRWKMPARNYVFSKPVSTSTSVDFFALDTTPIADNQTDSINIRLAWLESALKASTAKWKIVYGHHPVFSNGWQGPETRMVNLFKPLMEKYHVDVYFCGHDHDVEILQPVNGVHYIVSGGGGATDRDVTWRDNTIYTNTNGGFVWCAVTDNMLEAQCVDHSGTVKFSYDITKGQ